MAPRKGTVLSVDISNVLEEQAARYISGVTPWLAWIGGVPAATGLMMLTAAVTHHKTWVVASLAAATVIITFAVVRVSHQRGKVGRFHHAVNSLTALGWMTAAVRWGWMGGHGAILIAYAAGGLILCLCWNIRHSVRTDGLDDVVPASARGPRHKRVDFAYMIRVLAGRVPAIRAGAEKAGKAVPVLVGPWREDTTVPGGHTPAGAITAAPATPAEETADAKAQEAADRAWQAILKNWRDLTARKIPDLSGARLRPLSIRPWRISAEVVLVRGVHTPKAITDARELLASQNAMPLSSIIARPNRADHHRVYLDFVLQDILGTARFWPGPVAPGQSITAAPTRFGVYEDRRFAERFGPAIGTALAKALGWPEKNLSHLLSEGMNGSGKALALGTPVPTPGGWTTMGAIRAGDVVFDDAGQPCRVTCAWDVRHGRPCYEITFSDGSVIVADAEHQWLADTHKSRIADANQKVKRGCRTAAKPATGYARRTWPEVVTTATMAQAVRVRNGQHINYSIRVAAPLSAPAADLPVPPYLLGAWAGDGTSAAGHITTMDPEIITEIEAEGEQAHTTPSSQKGRAARYTIAGLQKRLRVAGLLGNKHIPPAYLRASETQRRALLAGLLDTDGHCTKSGAVEFCNTNERLARDVLHLISTLGYKASIRRKTARLYGKDCGPAWTVSFTPADKVFRLPRKAARQVTTVGAGAVHRYVTAVRPVPTVPVRCIAVDSPSHLFLAGETCIPTHNSTLSRILVTDWATRLDAEEWLIDTVKKNQTFGQLADAFEWFATTPAEARAMARFLAEVVIPARADYLGAHGYDNWEAGCGLPYLRVTIEEGGIIANELEKLDAVLNSARSTGVEISMSAQRAHHALVDTNVRAAFGDTASFGCKGGDDVFAMPDDLQAAGADPSLWQNKQPGMNFYAAAELELDRQLMPVRCFNIDARECREVIAEHVPARRQWIEENCPDWAEMLAAVDTQGVYAKRTTGKAILAAIKRAERARARKAGLDATPDQEPPGAAVPGDDEPGATVFPWPARPHLAEDDEIVEAEIVDDNPAGTPGADNDAPEEPVAISELDLEGDVAEGVAEDDGIDPAQPVPLDEDPVDFGRPAPGEGMPRDQAVAALRGYLTAKGPGWAFAPRDIYDDVCGPLGKSPAWVRGELGSFADTGLLTHDRMEGKYAVTEQARATA